MSFAERTITLLVVLFAASVGTADGRQSVLDRSRPGTSGSVDQQRPLVIPRINGPVTLDGLSNEAGWEGIGPLPVVMYRPNVGQPPSERTEILVAYDDDYFYVAGRLYDSEAEKIQANSKQRDSQDGTSEWFGIVIDSFNDKENALSFFTTPSGLRWDSAILNDAQMPNPWNMSWSTFWDVATVKNNEGWFAEIRVPFSSLRFQDIDGRVVLGLICRRYIARKNEDIVFPSISPRWGPLSYFKPSQARECVLEGVYSRKPLYLAPYVLGGSGQDFRLNQTTTAYERMDNLEREVGLDVKYGLTSNLTLDVTFNPDFAQVEADDQQVNLTRFSLYFPEKRLFFQERSSNFQFSFGGWNRLFYGRRIGIYKGELVRIYGGARLVGRVGPWDVGFLDMQTASVKDLPSENLGVLRIRRQVFNPYSYVGAITTTKLGADGSYNTAYGLDGIFRVVEDDYLTVRWAQTFQKELQSDLLSLKPARIFVEWERRTVKGFGYDLIFSQAGRDYNPGLGFETRQDFTHFGGKALFGWMPGEESPLFRHNVSLSGNLYRRNVDGATESIEFGPGWEFDTKSGYKGKIAPKYVYENVPQTFALSSDAQVPRGKYSFFVLSGELTTPQQKSLCVVAVADVGSFYDGTRTSLTLTPKWNILSDLELSGSYQYNHVTFRDRNQKFAAHIGMLRVLYMLSTELSASSFIQYNSAVDAVIGNVRFRYNPREGVDLYLVYNESLNTDRYRQVPALPLTSSRTVLLKYTYTFNI